VRSKRRPQPLLALPSTKPLGAPTPPHIRPHRRLADAIRAQDLVRRVHQRLEEPRLPARLAGRLREQEVLVGQHRALLREVLLVGGVHWGRRARVAAAAAAAAEGGGGGGVGGGIGAREWLLLLLLLLLLQEVWEGFGRVVREQD